MTEGRKVGILGSGTVAQRLGRGFAEHRFDVMLGTRDPKKLEEWKAASHGKVSVGSFAAAAAHGEIVVLATAGSGTEAALDLAGPEHFIGKLVLDASNPLDFSHGMPPGLLYGTSDSLGERVQRKLSHARVVKCFNTVSHAQMVDPHFREGIPLMMICGDDPGAKAETEKILRELGWPGALDVGGIDAARWLEALVPLWVRVGGRLETYEHAFRAVR